MLSALSNSPVYAFQIPAGAGRSATLTNYLKSQGYSGTITTRPEEVLGSEGGPPLLILDGIENGQLTNYLTYRWYQENPEKTLILLGSYFNPLLYSDLTPISLNYLTNLVTIFYHERGYPFEDPSLYSAIIETVKAAPVKTGILIFVASQKDIATLQKKWDLSTPLYTLDTFSDVTGPWALVVTSASPDVAYPPVKVVIDTLQDTTISSTVTGALIPRLRYISRAEADRRARYTSEPDSICYRLASKRFFDYLPIFPSEEMLSYPPDRISLSLAAVGVSPRLPEVFGDSTSLVNTLTSWGLLSQGKLTSLGAQALQSPLTIRSSVILSRWNGPVFPALCVLSIIDGYTSGYYWYPTLTTTQAKIEEGNGFIGYQDPSGGITRDTIPSEYAYSLKEHAEQYFTRFIGRSDLHTLVNIWVDLLEKMNGPSTRETPWNLEILTNWCQNNSISLSQIRTTQTLLDMISGSFQSGPFTTDGIIDKLRPLLSDFYPTLTRVNMDGVYTDGVQEYRLTSLVNRSQLLSDPPLKLLPLITSEVSDGLVTSNYIIVGLNL